MREEPDREPWPLCPRVEVLPMPEPIPRPMRFLFSFAFLGARRLERLRIAIVSSLNAGGLAAQRLACGWCCVMGADPLPGCYTRIKCIAQRRRHYLVCARTGGHPRPDNYSTTRTRWGTF